MKTFEGEIEMYDHLYVMGELVRQREEEIARMVYEANLKSKKPFICYIPILKDNKQCGCY